MNIFCYILLFVITHFSGANTILNGKVIKVSDGDTITILTSSHKQVKIRLSGIDCPESRQDFGTKAKQFTSAFCFGKDVHVEVVGQDRYERFLGLVYNREGQSLNKELIKAGLAWHYKYFDNSEELAHLEQSARRNKVGLWSMKNPIAPWDYRRLSH